MRKVKVAAIQPGQAAMPESCNWQSSAYRNNPMEILGNYLAKQMDVTFKLLEQAGREGCDIATSCEDSAGVGFYMADVSERNLFTELVARSAPMLEARFSDIADRFSMYVVGCYYKQIQNTNCNIATIFDRNGNPVGRYQKTHLPPDETWQSAAGGEIAAFDLDFGRIGLAICYDMMFPEMVQVLALKGAEVIFHPTFGYGWYDGIGEATLRTRANDNSVHIVTAKNARFNGAGKSSVIDFWGHVLAEAGFDENVIVTRDIDLDKKKTQPEWHNPTRMSGISDVGVRMSRERRPELYGIICEPLKNRFAAPPIEEQKAIMEQIKDGRCRW